MKTKRMELLSKNATPAEIEAAIDAHCKRQGRPSALRFTVAASIGLVCLVAIPIRCIYLHLYVQALVSYLFIMGCFGLIITRSLLQVKSLFRMGRRFLDQAAPLTFRQTLIGYSYASKKQKKQSLERVLQTLREVSEEEVATLAPKERTVFLQVFLNYSASKIVLETMNLARRLELVEALPFLEGITRRQSGLYRNREVCIRAKEVAEFLRPLAALQRTEAQLLRPVPASTPPEQLLRVPQEMNEPEINLLRPVE